MVKYLYLSTTVQAVKFLHTTEFVLTTRIPLPDIDRLEKANRLKLQVSEVVYEAMQIVRLLDESVKIVRFGFEFLGYQFDDEESCSFKLPYSATKELQNIIELAVADIKGGYQVDFELIDNWSAPQPVAIEPQPSEPESQIAALQRSLAELTARCDAMQSEIKRLDAEKQNVYRVWTQPVTWNPLGPATCSIAGSSGVVVQGGLVTGDMVTSRTVQNGLTLTNHSVACSPRRHLTAEESSSEPQRHCTSPDHAWTNTPCRLAQPSCTTTSGSPVMFTELNDERD